jgi:anti-sigma-K factor RskA
MMTEFKNKNIDELLSKFFSPDQAEQIKNDFISADALFEKFPAPAPSQQRLADIKQKMAHRLENQKRISPLWDALRHWTAVLLKTAAVAAIIVTASAVMLLNFNQEKPTQYSQNIQQTSVWQSTDTSISSFEAEIEQLKNELLTINLGEENGTNGILTDRVEQIELETIETENTFWKG